MMRWRLLFAVIAVSAAVPRAADAGHLSSSGHGLAASGSHGGSSTSGGAVQPGGLAADHANVTHAGTVHQHDAHAQQLSNSGQTAAHALARPAPSDLMIGLPPHGRPTIMLVGQGQHSNTTAPKSHVSTGTTKSSLANQGSGVQIAHSQPAHPAAAQTGGPTRPHAPTANPPASNSTGGSMVAVINLSSGGGSRNPAPVILGTGTPSTTTTKTSVSTISIVAHIPTNALVPGNHGPVVPLASVAPHDVLPPQNAPEPGSILIFGSALAVLLLFKRQSVLSS